MKICVYCSSSSKINKIYFEATEKLAKEFIKENVQVVYGGGGNGLMGHLADTIIDNGGMIKGISPKFMQDIEWTHKRLIDLEICLLYTSPSPRDATLSRMPSSA